MQSCSLSPTRAPSYLDGLWNEINRRPRYRLRNADADNARIKFQGACDEPVTRSLKQGARPPRPLRDLVSRQYEWSPQSCTLRTLEQSVAATCAKLQGRRISFIGDSICEQTFVSAAHLLGANFSAPSTLSSRDNSVQEREVRACGDTVALRLIRTDLLLWEASSRMVAETRLFRFYPTLFSVNSAALNSDVVVLGFGQHYANTAPPFYNGVRDAWGSSMKLGPSWLTWRTVFEQSLNTTLSPMLASRRAHGLSDSSVILMSPTQPVPTCWEYDEPIGSAAEAKRHTFWPQGNRVQGNRVYPRSDTRFAKQWTGWQDHREVARRLAASSGVAYLDIYPLAGKRPDAAVGRRHSPEKAQFENDCVHFCLPGPPDTWNRLLFNHILDKLEWPSLSSSSATPLEKLGYPSSINMAKAAHLKSVNATVQSPWWWPYETVGFHAQTLRNERKAVEQKLSDAVKREKLNAASATEYFSMHCSASKQKSMENLAAAHCYLVKTFSAKLIALSSQLTRIENMSADLSWPIDSA